MRDVLVILGSGLAMVVMAARIANDWAGGVIRRQAMGESGGRMPGGETLSERLGLTPAKDVMYDLGDEFTGTVGSGDVGTDGLEADRRATVGAVAKWLDERLLSNSARGIREQLLGGAGR